MKTVSVFAAVAVGVVLVVGLATWSPTSSPVSFGGNVAELKARARDQAAAAARGKSDVSPAVTGLASESKRVVDSSFMRALVSSAVDPSASPCTDFYQYACNGWIRQFPDVSTSVNVAFNKIARDNAQVEQNIFDNAQDDLVRPFTDACRDVSGIVQRGLRDLKPFAAGYAPSKWSSVSDFVAATTKGFSGSVFFDAVVGQYAEDATKWVLVLQKAGFNDEWWYPASAQSKYADIVAHALDQLGIDTSLAADVVAFEYALYNIPSGVQQTFSSKELKNHINWDWEKILSSSNIDIDHEEFEVTIEDDTYWKGCQILANALIASGKKDVLYAYGAYRLLQDVQPLLPESMRLPDPPMWKSSGDELSSFKKERPAAFKFYAERIERSEREYRAFEKHLNMQHGIGVDILGEVEPPLLHHSRTDVLRVARYTERYYKEHRDDEDVAAFGDSASLWPRSDTNKYTCAQFTKNFLQDVVGKMFADAVWGDAEGVQAEVTDMVDHVRKQFRKNLQANSWLDDTTKAAAIEKADNIVQLVGFPEVGDYSDISISDSTFLLNMYQISVHQFNQRMGKVFETVDRTEWMPAPNGAVSTVNAFYRPSRNTINLMLGLITFKFYNSSFATAYNYGGYGSVVGHEITHAFDNNGRRFDEVGNFRNWWTSHSLSENHQRLTCYINQYDSFPIGDEHVSGTNTVGENQADNGGLRAAFYAYRTKVGEAPEDRRVLTQYTDDQLFFLSFAQNWCGKFNEDYMISTIDERVHAPGFARVLGTLRNMPEFAKAFNCPTGSPMNPSNKCSMW